MTGTLTPASTDDARAGGARRGAVPTAQRVRRRSALRDVRLWLGLLLVAGSVVLGARLLAAADDTVSVWSLAHDLPAGSPVDADDLAPVDVRFADAASAQRYLPAGAPLPDGVRLAHDVTAGELLPRAALTQRTEQLVEVPVAAPADRVPATVSVGSTVDVWVAPPPGSDALGGRPAPAVRVLDDVVVVALPATQATLAPSGDRQVIVGVARDQADALGEALAGVAGGQVVLTREG